MKRHAVYVGDKGEIKKRKLAESCIESTETILRKFLNPTYQFPGSGKGSDRLNPPLWLTLLNGANSTKVNLSDTEDKELYDLCKGKASLFKDECNLAEILNIGQGVAFINNEGWDGTVSEENNLHCFSVLNIDSGKVRFSDISEDLNSTKKYIYSTEEKTVTATTVADLREQTGYNKTKFIVGRLHVAAQPAIGKSTTTVI